MDPQEEAQIHLDQAAEEQRKAAELYRQQAEELKRQAEAAEQGKVGGEVSSGWNPFG